MNAIELGASLYVPALHASCAALARGALAELRSMIVCLEDSIRSDQVEAALTALAGLLSGFVVAAPTVAVFVRPRGPDMAALVARMPGAERLSGYVLPKATVATLPDWLRSLPDGRPVMPTIEGREAFDREALMRFSEALSPHRDRLAAVRIGGNDVLGLLGVRRSRDRTAYDGPLATVIRDVASVFLPEGIPVAAPVFEHFGRGDVLKTEVDLDVEHGLLTKSAIHPDQVRLIHDLYRPSLADVAEARAMVDVCAPAVFGVRGSMCEPATHSTWATTVLERARVFGLRDEARILGQVA